MERVLIARGEPYSVVFDAMWVVLDADGVAVGHGFAFGEGAYDEAVTAAAACYDLRFDGPLPAVIRDRALELRGLKGG